MNCPVDGTPLWGTGPGNDDYQCPACRLHWTIVAQQYARVRFNRNAPFAQLVIDVDAIHGAEVRRSKREPAA